jgi:hypothetical protein
MSVAVTGGGINKSDAEIERPVQGAGGIPVILRTPTAADRPAAESNLGYVPTSLSESSDFYPSKLRDGLISCQHVTRSGTVAQQKAETILKRTSGRE